MNCRNCSILFRGKRRKIVLRSTSLLMSLVFAGTCVFGSLAPSVARASVTSKSLIVDFKPAVKVVQVKLPSKAYDEVKSFGNYFESVMFLRVPPTESMTIESIRLKLQLDHPEPERLRIELTSPQGKKHIIQEGPQVIEPELPPEEVSIFGRKPGVVEVVTPVDRVKIAPKVRNPKGGFVTLSPVFESEDDVGVYELAEFSNHYDAFPFHPGDEAPEESVSNIAQTFDGLSSSGIWVVRVTDPTIQCVAAPHVVNPLAEEFVQSVAVCDPVEVGAPTTPTGEPRLTPIVSAELQVNGRPIAGGLRESVEASFLSDSLLEEVQMPTALPEGRKFVRFPLWAYDTIGEELYVDIKASHPRPHDVRLYLKAPGDRRRYVGRLSQAEELDDGYMRLSISSWRISPLLEKSVTGRWQLYAMDTVRGVQGSISGWRLEAKGPATRQIAWAFPRTHDEAVNGHRSECCWYEIPVQEVLPGRGIAANDLGLVIMADPFVEEVDFTLISPDGQETSGTVRNGEPLLNLVDPNLKQVGELSIELPSGKSQPVQVKPKVTLGDSVFVSVEDSAGAARIRPVANAVGTWLLKVKSPSLAHSAAQGQMCMPNEFLQTMPTESIQFLGLIGAALFISEDPDDPGMEQEILARAIARADQVVGLHEARELLLSSLGTLQAALADWEEKRTTATFDQWIEQYFAGAMLGSYAEQLINDISLNVFLGNLPARMFEELDQVLGGRLSSFRSDGLKELQLRLGMGGSDILDLLLSNWRKHLDLRQGSFNPQIADRRTWAMAGGGNTDPQGSQGTSDDEGTEGNQKTQEKEKSPQQKAKEIYDQMREERDQEAKVAQKTADAVMIAVGVFGGPLGAGIAVAYGVARLVIDPDNHDCAEVQINCEDTTPHTAELLNAMKDLMKSFTPGGRDPFEPVDSVNFKADWLINCEPERITCDVLPGPVFVQQDTSLWMQDGVKGIKKLETVVDCPPEEACTLNLNEKLDFDQTCVNSPLEYQSGVVDPPEIDPGGLGPGDVNPPVPPEIDVLTPEPFGPVTSSETKVRIELDAAAKLIESKIGVSPSISIR